VNSITRLFPLEAPENDKKKQRRDSVATESAKLEEGDGPSPIDVLVDAIIGFLEKGTSFLRTVANQSFSLLAARLERHTIELILTVSAIPSYHAIVLD
jgi:DNA polymerase phi